MAKITQQLKGLEMINNLIENAKSFAKTIAGLRGAVSDWETKMVLGVKLDDDENRRYLRLKKRISDLEVMLLCAEKNILLIMIDEMKDKVVEAMKKSMAERPYSIENRTFTEKVALPIYAELQELFKDTYAFCTIKSLPEIKVKVAEFKTQHQDLLG